MSEAPAPKLSNHSGQCTTKGWNLNSGHGQKRACKPDIPTTALGQDDAIGRNSLIKKPKRPLNVINEIYKRSSFALEAPDTQPHWNDMRKPLIASRQTLN